MILISKNESKLLRESGFGRYITISSKTHKGRSKRYYLTENNSVLKVLDNYRKESIVSKV